ncbi:MAG TPA: transporter substrate-binding domain-containing protein [Syntrophorhabdales bacterium]|nr:transporter substrate-binding domain-containing protein [Syntrophorhabdales bacterium]
MIRLAYDNPFPPLAFGEGGKARGAVIDILSEAFARIHIQVSFIPTPMEHIRRLLDAGEADGIAFYAITPERKALFDFSDPLLMTGAALFVKSPDPPTDLQDYENRRIVTPRTGPLSAYIRREVPGARLLLVKDYSEALETVLAGNADAAALNVHVGRDLIHRLFRGRFTLPDKVFLEMPLAVATMKGSDSSLLETINEGLRCLKKEGTYARIMETWFGHVRPKHSLRSGEV